MLVMLMITSQSPRDFLSQQSMATAPPALLRGLSFARLHLHRRVAFAHQRPIWRKSVSTQPQENEFSDAPRKASVRNPAKLGRMNQPYYRKWVTKEQEIFDDIKPIVSLVKEILHSDRYMDGAQLTVEDEKAIVEKLLAYHPHCDDKIGCGLNSIMVDRHPLFKGTRCLFVVRKDGAWIDFSYQKCIRAYIHQKYPTDAEKFIRAYFKRLSY